MIRPVLTQPPREWQIQALNAWRPQMRGTISVVTGAGKTYFALLCINEYAGRVPDGRTVVVVPTTALMDQWFVSLQEDAGVPASDIALFSGEEKGEMGRRLSILVINTAREIIGEMVGRAPTMLVVDECHRAGSRVNSRALEGTHAATLGLSATPVREYDNAFQEVIEPALGPIVYEYDYRSALADGVIAPFDLVNVRIDLLPDESHRYDQITRRIAREAHYVSRGNRTDENLKRLLQIRASISSTAAMRVPVAAKLAEESSTGRTLVFHERVSDSNSIAKLLGQRNHNVGVYHTGIGPAIRRNNLQLFRRGLFDVLVTCRALDEGLNVPETSTAIIASATASRRQRIQRLGRVLRPAPGKRASTVFTIYATDVEERRLVAESDNLLGVAAVEWRHASHRSQ